MKKKKKPTKESWFAVHARFAIQLEAQNSGLQTYEDRILLVKAAHSDDAVKKLQPEFKKYGRPYLNFDGFMVRWAFERVLSTQQLYDAEISATRHRSVFCFGQEAYETRIRMENEARNAIY
jgi:hypothetical protein